MNKKQIEQQRQQARQRQARQLVLGGVVVIALLLGIVWWTTGRSGNVSGGIPISRLSTGDFHALAFSAVEPETVYFGHHGGLMVSRNWGRHLAAGVNR